MNDKDLQMVDLVKSISARGNHAEVKQNKNGDWVVYEVKKSKRVG